MLLLRGLKPISSVLFSWNPSAKRMSAEPFPGPEKPPKELQRKQITRAAGMWRVCALVNNVMVLKESDGGVYIS